MKNDRKILRILPWRCMQQVTRSFGTYT